MLKKLLLRIKAERVYHQTVAKYTFRKEQLPKVKREFIASYIRFSNESN